MQDLIVGMEVGKGKFTNKDIINGGEKSSVIKQNPEELLVIAVYNSIFRAGGIDVMTGTKWG